jgi:hypothetical protein
VVADISLEVQADASRIVVTCHWTDLTVTYQKQVFVPKRSWADHRVITPPVSAFRFRAFHAARDKARELGWIV